MVYNHPSGDPTPSQADIEITRAVEAAGEALGIALHDHVIVTRSDHHSLRASGLI
jgi:DNA repair protein RadC